MSAVAKSSMGNARASRELQTLPGLSHKVAPIVVDYDGLGPFVPVASFKDLDLSRGISGQRSTQRNAYPCLGLAHGGKDRAQHKNASHSGELHRTLLGTLDFDDDTCPSTPPEKNSR